jgi:hypothetical protein
VAWWDLFAVSLVSEMARAALATGGGRGGRHDVLEERRRLILQLHCPSEVWFDKVSERGYVCEVGDGIIFTHSDSVKVG